MTPWRGLLLSLVGVMGCATSTPQIQITTWVPHLGSSPALLDWHTWPCLDDKGQPTTCWSEDYDDGRHCTGAFHVGYVCAHRNDWRPPLAP